MTLMARNRDEVARQDLMRCPVDDAEDRLRIEDIATVPAATSRTAQVRLPFLFFPRHGKDPTGRWKITKQGDRDALA